MLTSGEIEILAPAKNMDIGIAAINCGADALYIAGPSFGAREAAGNSIEDIDLLVKYARRYGVKVYMVINTILYDSEIDEAVRLANRACNIGCDALIVQDLGLIKAGLPPIPVFASTQTDIRGVEQAKAMEILGFSRLILARELSLREIGEIRDAVNIELESFVHGALCVSYSGQCYMSQRVTGRSGNRGECSQMCRSEYNLLDSSGRYIARERALLSLKDLNLAGYIDKLIEVGITSFKIEGRLKNASYVKNIVRYYRSVVDNCLEGRNRSADGIRYNKPSLGKIYGGFSPNPDYTYSRGYTTFNIEGVRGNWCSGESTKSIGEYVGMVNGVGEDNRGNTIFTCVTASGIKLSNGDGLLFTPAKRGGLRERGVIGARISVVEAESGGYRVFLNEPLLLSKGDEILRNYNHVFEKELESNMPLRYIEVELNVVCTGSTIVVTAESEDGRREQISLSGDFEEARDAVAMRATIERQLGKSSGIYLFRVAGIEGGKIPFLPLSLLNEKRRELAHRFDANPGKGEEKSINTRREVERANKVSRAIIENKNILSAGLKFDYRANIVNRFAKEFYDTLSGGNSEWGFESTPVEEAELMRCKYCIKFELGYCLRQHTEFARPKLKEPLWLENGKRRFRLEFDCNKCEMIILG